MEWLVRLLGRDGKPRVDEDAISDEVSRLREKHAASKARSERVLEDFLRSDSAMKRGLQKDDDADGIH